jgi:hypothetical protein
MAELQEPASRSHCALLFSLLKLGLALSNGGELQDYEVLGEDE